MLRSKPSPAELCGECGNKANHGEPAIELTRAGIPSLHRLRRFHAWFAGIDIARLAIGRDLSGGSGKG